MTSPTSPPYVNPMHYGAVGDGITDDTVALQNALTAISSGGVLFLPAGKVFLYTGTLTIPNGAVVQGAGRGEASGSTFYPQFIAGSSSALITMGTESTMRDVLIDCASTADIGIYISTLADHPCLQSVQVNRHCKPALCWTKPRMATSSVALSAIAGPRPRPRDGPRARYGF